MIVKLEESATWPDHVVQFLTKNRDLLSDHYAYSADIIRQRAKNPSDVSLAMKLKTNPFREDRERIVDSIELRIRDFYVVVWHSTRLCSDEISEINTNGLMPLTVRSFRDRIQARVNAGDLSQEDADTLFSDGDFVEGHRLGSFWVWLTSSGVAQPWAAKYFNIWGGEALFDNIECKLGDKLKSIGQPAIVELTLDVGRLDARCVASTIVAIYERDCGWWDGSAICPDGCTREGIDKSCITRILTEKDSEFQKIVMS